MKKVVIILALLLVGCIEAGSPLVGKSVEDGAWTPTFSVTTTDYSSTPAVLIKQPLVQELPDNVKAMTDEFMVSLWVLPLTEGVIMDTGGWKLSIEGGDLVFEVGSADAKHSGFFETYKNQWVQIAATFNEGGMVLYVNGVEQGVGALFLGVAVYPVGGKLVIGGSQIAGSAGSALSTETTETGADTSSGGTGDDTVPESALVSTGDAPSNEVIPGIVGPIGSVPDIPGVGTDPDGDGITVIVEEDTSYGKTIDNPSVPGGTNLPTSYSGPYATIKNSDVLYKAAYQMYQGVNIYSNDDNLFVPPADKDKRILMIINDLDPSLKYLNGDIPFNSNTVVSVLMDPIVPGIDYNTDTRDHDCVTPADIYDAIDPVYDGVTSYQIFDPTMNYYTLTVYMGGFISLAVLDAMSNYCMAGSTQTISSDVAFDNFGSEYTGASQVQLTCSSSNADCQLNRVFQKATFCGADKEVVPKSFFHNIKGHEPGMTYEIYLSTILPSGDDYDELLVADGTDTICDLYTLANSLSNP